MAGPSATIGRQRRLGRRPLAIALALACAVGAVAVAPPPAAQALSTWTGGVSLYRSGVFTTQKTWLWCTAADIQIIRNIVRGTRDHTTANQRHYFDWMRRHNRYTLPLSAGVDAQGWAAGMAHYVDARYRLVSSSTFTSALRNAVTRMRLTNLPVGVTVSRGNHAWILVGFQATADPATTTHFTVTSVRVVGPLYGLQSRNGYDMKPNTKLSVTQFRKFFTPWRYAPKRMIWDGRYISIQPVPSTAATTSTTADTAAAAIVTPRAVPIAGWIGPSVMAGLAVSLATSRIRARSRRPRRSGASRGAASRHAGRLRRAGRA